MNIVSPFRDEHDFQRVAEGSYQFTVSELNTDFDIQHVRRERYQLHAEVTAYCGLPGVHTYNGLLFNADVNLSNLRDRDTLARTLANRTSSVSHADAQRWAGVVTELCARVKQAEDVGVGIVNLRDVGRPDAQQFLRVGRLLLPRTHPALIFGDGDSLKTYIGGHIVAALASQGIRVAIADWELTAPDHRERFDRLTGQAADVLYIPCARPLIHEVDRIAHAMHEHRSDYLLLDSAAPACNGRPEDSENAAAYFRALRALGKGSLTIAHTNRSEQSDQKPFGSVFWFNLSRAIWYVKRAESNVPGTVEIGLYPRKFNLGAPQRATAFRFTFTDEKTDVTSIDISDVDSLASKLPLKDRIVHLVRSRARSIPELAEELESDSETIGRTVRRYSGDKAKVQLFTKLPNDRIGLVERRAS